MSTNSFKIKNSAVLTPKDLSTLVTPEAGEIACDINDSNKIKRYDAASASWVEVGSGGVGSVDIMFVQDFESASLSSFTQTGLSLSTTNPLHGKVSALLTHQAAVNQSFKQVIAVDPKFRGQAMVLDLNIKSAASAGNVVIKVRDESNSADLISSEALQLSSAVSGRRSSVSFTIPSTCSSLSYTITALPEAGSPVTRIDDIVSYLGDVALLETSVLVPVMTAWQGYTPTFQGFGTPSNVEFEWRQVGENVEIRGKFTSGTSTAVEARVGLPAGLSSASTSLIPSLQMIGKGNQDNFSTTNFSGVSVLIEPSVTYVTFGQEISTANGLTKRNASNILSSGQSLSFFASVPCAGLNASTTKTIPLTQSGLVQNADSLVRVDTANGFGSTGTKIRRFSSLIQSLGTDITYSDSVTNGASFTINTSGIYSIVYSDYGSTQMQVAISKNATSLSTNAANLSNLQEVLTYASPAGNSSGVAQWTGYLSAGDIIRPHTNGVTGATALTSFTIARQGSLKQIAVSSDQKITIPTSELRFEGASARGTGTEAAIVQFTSMAKLRGDAFTIDNSNGTAITMKKAGKLDISTNLYATASRQFAITKNQAVRSTDPALASEILAIEYSTGTGDVYSLSWSGYVSIGDIIRVSGNGAPVANIGNSLNLSFQEQDISVSVTNTLPQFSDSDSSVRVNTANGYGSTASNKIRRFSSVVENLGSDITYLDDPANGATFTIMSSGVYNITYTDQFSAQCLMGLSKNASSLTSAIQSLSASQILSVANSVSANQPESVSWQGYLSAGDIIRPHSEGTSAGTTTSAVNFTISKVGKPNVTGVNVTPFVNLPQPESQSSFASSGTSLAGSGTKSTLSPSITKGSGIYSFNSTTGIYTVLKSAKFNLSFSLRAVSASNVSPEIAIGSISTVVSRDTSVATSGYWANAQTTVNINAGDTFSFSNSGAGSADFQTISILAEALSDQILTAPESFSTDTASLTYAPSSSYTLSTLQNAPVGTFITFTYAANTNTRTQTTTAPTQTTADMNTNGMLIYSRAYNAASTAAQPAAIAIQIGKGLKGRSLDLYKSVAKTTSGEVGFTVSGSSGQSGFYFNAYDEKTGILYVDSGATTTNTITSNTFFYTDTTNQTSGYLVINASRSPALTGVPLLQPRIATLSDVKASGTAGGASTTTYSARTLNTMDDPTGIVTSLASNQFTLPAGEYYIEASAPTFGAVGDTKVKLRNISDSTDAIIGFSSYGTTNVVPRHSLSGKVIITSSKVFELQHRTAAAIATNGFGVNNSFGESEIYSIVKITKVK